MKICPICGVEYSDDAQYCAKCKTVLIEKKEKKPVPTNYKGLAIAIVGTMLFIGAIYGFIYLMSLIS